MDFLFKMNYLIFFLQIEENLENFAKLIQQKKSKKGKKRKFFKLKYLNF